MSAPATSLTLVREREPRQLAPTRDSHALEPTGFGEALQAAEMLFKSGLIQGCNNPAAVLAVVLKGRELGMPMMQSLTEIHLIKGKVSLSAAAMVGLCLSSGAAEYFTCTETSAASATYETQRRGDPTGPKRLTFTMDEARAAGLASNDNYRKSPADMLRARAASKLARMVYPDVLAGCYTPDEMDDFDRPAPAAERPPVQTQARVVETAPRLPAKPAKKTATLDDLRASLEKIADAAALRKVADRWDAAVAKLPEGDERGALAQGGAELITERARALTAPEGELVDDAAPVEE